MKGGTATVNHHLLLIIIILSPFITTTTTAAVDDDATVMQALRKTLNPPPTLGWTGDDYCNWPHIGCSGNKVTRIQLGYLNLQSGSLPPNLSSLTSLERLELQSNNLTGPLPSLTGLTSLQIIMLSHNQFTSIPPDFFTGLTSLQSVEIDNNPFTAWEIPDTLRDSSGLQNFSANSANITGDFPDFFSPDNFPGLLNLHLAFNNLQGELPTSLSGSTLQSLWLNGQRLSGNLHILQNMTYLEEVWLHSNVFTGPLPDFSNLLNLETFSVRDNSLTGIIPNSLTKLPSLKVANLTNNLFQGPMPGFNPSVSTDVSNGGLNSFCLPKPSENCDPQVDVMLSVAESLGYPVKFAESWKGNDVCADWVGIICVNGNVTVINFSKMGLNGTVSADFGKLKSLQKLILANNNLIGTIPMELGTDLPVLKTLDLSNNQLHGKIPVRNNLVVNVAGNPDIGKEKPSSTTSSSSSTTTSSGNSSSQTAGAGSPSGSDSSSSQDSSIVYDQKSSLSKPTVIILCTFVGFFALLVIGIVSFCLYRRKQKRFSQVQSPNAMVVHPRNSGSDNESVKITVAAGSNITVGGLSEAHMVRNSELMMGGGGGRDNIQMVEAGSMVISIQVLRTVTDNFSENNILGQGGFGTVYKGELHDGTKIAVKRMEMGVITGKGSTEFTSEIAVLTKVRHRHLVALLGYCLDGNEKLLVYEYMPQGTLSSHIFHWAEEGLKPLEWTRRLSIALDVARGVEYLHTLAHQSFIHRDLKPSNILLGDDMRAKVADFGLVRLAPEGKGSIETRIAGTFGYLAPEYAVTGRVTTKVDVFSFGVILMELITGRRALDESQSEESVHLVTWFKRMHINKETFGKAIDPALDLDDDTLASIKTVAELAGHCCAREPYQRPDMGHAVNVLSSLVELWKPTEMTADDIYGIDLDMSLPQALKKWQAFEGSQAAGPSSSSFVASLDNTQTSIPTMPFGFADSFTSADGR